MRIAQVPGEPFDCGRAALLLDPQEPANDLVATPPVSREDEADDEDRFRLAAERLRAIVEKRGMA